jgi:hypothetical protein
MPTPLKTGLIKRSDVGAKPGNHPEWIRRHPFKKVTITLHKRWFRGKPKGKSIGEHKTINRSRTVRDRTV